MSAVIDPIESRTIAPPVPESLEDSGIPATIVEHLVLKYLYFRGELVGRDIANLLGFQFSVTPVTRMTSPQRWYCAAM